MKRWFVGLLVATLLSLGATRPAMAASEDVFAFIAGVLLMLGEDETAAQAQRQRELEAQNELMRRYIAEQVEREQRMRDAERRRIESEVERRKAAVAKAETSISTGSGFFLAASGYVVTNAHVVEGKKFTYARERDGKIFSATVIGTDGAADLALLKVKVQRRGLAIGQFSSVTKGQKVYAIGYPAPSLQGSESKITDGIISSFTGLANDERRYQVSTPIQPGNSGGPLVNERAEVIGVLVAKVSDQKFVEAAGSLPQNVNYAVRTDALVKFLQAQGIVLGTIKPTGNPLDHADASTVMIISASEPIRLPVDTEILAADAEADAWQLARNEGTCNSLDSFIRLYRSSKNYAAALKLRSGAEAKAWKEAQRVNTIVSYKDYEANCPGGKRRSEIQRSLAAIESQEAKVKAELDQLNAAAKGSGCRELELFIRKNPNGRYLSEAKDYIRKIEDHKYNYARKANDASAWNDLIENCPNSGFVEEARKATKLLAAQQKAREVEKGQLHSMQAMYAERRYVDLSAYAQAIIDGGNAKVAPYAFAGIANLKLGKLVYAEDYLGKALSFAPSDPQLKLVLSQVNLMLGNSKEALNTLAGMDSIQLPATIRKAAYSNLAVAHYRLTNDTASSTYLDKVMELDGAAGEKLRKTLNIGGVAGPAGGSSTSNRKRVTEDQWWAIFVASALLNKEWVQAANMSLIYTEKVPDTAYGWYARALAKFAIDDRIDAEKSFAEGYRRDPALIGVIGKVLANRKANQLLNSAHVLLTGVDPSAASAFKEKYLSEGRQ